MTEHRSGSKEWFFFKCMGELLYGKTWQVEFSILGAFGLATFRLRLPW